MIMRKAGLGNAGRTRSKGVCGGDDAEEMR